MNKKVSKILTFVVGFVALIGFYFFFQIMAKGDEAIKASAELQESILSPYIWFALILLVVVSGIAVLSSLFNILTRPAVLKKTLASLAVLAVLLFVAYALASDAAVTNSVGEVLKDGAKGATSKWVGTGIYYSFILGTIALVMFLVDFVRSLVK